MDNKEEFEEFEGMSEEEKLEAENAFLKMKLFMESGAEIHNASGEELPLEIQNIFLKYIKTFNEEVIFGDKKPLQDLYPQLLNHKEDYENGIISSKDMRPIILQALEDLQVKIDVLSPYVTDFDLLDFIFNEVYLQEFSKVSNPDFVFHIVYDEIRPEYYYESKESIENELMPFLFFDTGAAEDFDISIEEGFRFNNSTNALSLDFIKEIAQKNATDLEITSIEDFQLDIEQCEKNEQHICLVGTYKVNGQNVGFDDRCVFKADIAIERSNYDQGEEEDFNPLDDAYETLKLTSLYLSHFEL